MDLEIAPIVGGEQGHGYGFLRGAVCGLEACAGCGLPPFPSAACGTAGLPVCGLGAGSVSVPDPGVVDAPGENSSACSGCGGGGAGLGLLVSCSGCWSGGRLGSIRPGSFSAIISDAFTWSLIAVGTTSFCE